MKFFRCSIVWTLHSILKARSLSSPRKPEHRSTRFIKQGADHEEYLTHSFIHTFVHTWHTHMLASMLLQKHPLNPKPYRSSIKAFVAPPVRASELRHISLNPKSYMPTHRLHCSSFLGLPYRISNINHKKDLQQSLEVDPKGTV